MIKRIVTKITIIFVMFISFHSAKANAYNYDYEWTHNHPILIEYVQQHKDEIIDWTPLKLTLSNQYEHFIYNALKRENVPKEIIILAGIESGFRTDVISHAQAVGMWQFLEATAKDWGLEINETIDDRTDWKKATVAAARYLHWMANAHFDGNYEMAILAYNAGIGRIKRLSVELNTSDPWVIIEHGNLSKESREYLPKFLSYMHYYFYIQNN